eukprot:365333-Chlamydomonas_euryale.AAC.23
MKAPCNQYRQSKMRPRSTCCSCDPHHATSTGNVLDPGVCVLLMPHPANPCKSLATDTAVLL